MRPRRLCTVCKEPLPLTAHGRRKAHSECNFGPRRPTTISADGYRIAGILDLLSPGKGEELTAALRNGTKLRLFRCDCGKIYIGPNHNRCDVCVNGSGTDDWFPGHRSRKNKA